VLERPSEAPSLAIALSLIVDLIQGHVDAAATNKVHWGARLALTAVLSHFPELELELKLLGSRYNTDQMKDEMEVFLTRNHQASESLSLRVPPLVARSPPDGAGE
jgi:hypothetical protein